jgi:hypothetical protein
VDLLLIIWVIALCLAMAAAVVTALFLPPEDF